jgi:hypothetical protein
LKEKLAMNDDRDLEEWAQDNIKDLFWYCLAIFISDIRASSAEFDSDYQL